MTSLATTLAAPDAATLKAKERERRAAWPQPFALRVHRAVSWLGRAEKEPDDRDAAFILLWIALNAAYADLDADSLDERGRFAQFAADLVRLDGAGRIYDALWSRFSQEVRLIFDNRYVFRPFWDHHNSGGSLARDWPERLNDERAKVYRAFAGRETARTLVFLFGRLYVLRFDRRSDGGADFHDVGPPRPRLFDQAHRTVWAILRQLRTPASRLDRMNVRRRMIVGIDHHTDLSDREDARRGARRQ